MMPLMGYRKGHNELTDAQRRAYKLERVINFRWVARLLGKSSNYALSSKDLASDTLQLEISQIGQFAEVACGLYEPSIIWKHFDLLSRPGYPFERHDALRGTELLDVIRGFAGMQVLLAFRAEREQLVVAFSGTYNFVQTMYVLNAFKAKYPGAGTFERGRFKDAKVHAGFWRLYCGVRRAVLRALADQLSGSEKTLHIKEIVVTGHSLGAGLSLFLIMDLLNPESCSNYLKERFAIPSDVSISIVLFGSPRVGNSIFVELYRNSVARFREAHGTDGFTDFSIKAYNDGVPALPPHSIGYRHSVASALYLHHGRLYHTPSSECESSIFSVVHDEIGYEPLHPLGGHNYYNGRDMERTMRRMGWVTLSRTKSLEGDWERKYLEKLERERCKLECRRKSSSSRAQPETKGELQPAE